MKNRLMIVGAGGHGKVVADLAEQLGYKDISFLDDRSVGTCLGYPIVGTSDSVLAYKTDNTDFVVAIGDNQARQITAEKYDVNWVTLIHPSAQVSKHAEIGEGTVVLECAKVNACAKVGKHCILNSGALIGHDSVLGKYTHVSANAAVGGTSYIGSGTLVGIGATLRNNVTVCEKCTIGAGAVVVRNLTEPGTYVGVPAKKVK